MENMILSRERVADMLCGALEGGSNYWYYLPNLKKVREVTPELKGEPLVDRIITAVYDYNIYIDVCDLEDQETVLGMFSLESIKKGEQLMLKEQPKMFADILSENDDAETADVWFQFVVMGEIVFC